MKQPSNESSPSSAPTDAAQVRLEQRPGVLQGGAVLTLQTAHAQRLVKGRAQSTDKPAIIGLLGFANQLRTLWNAARDDDPYADWWLLKVRDALDHTSDTLSAMTVCATERIESMDALEVTLPVSTRPARIALNFSNPYAFRAARLIAAFDMLACQLLSARHVGLLSREEAEVQLHQGGRITRRMLQSPAGYRFPGLTRADVMAGTAKARQAIGSMGAVPDDVLQGTRRAPDAPTIVRTPRPDSATDAMQLHALPDVG